MHEFAAFARLHAEHPPAIGILRQTTRIIARQIEADHRNGKFRPQSHFAALAVGGDEHPAAEVFARLVEKNIGRLQHGRFDPCIAKPRKAGDQIFGREA